MDDSFQPSAWQIDIPIRQEEHRKDEKLAFMLTGSGDTCRRAMIRQTSMAPSQASALFRRRFRMLYNSLAPAG